jgi:hypothetical protein
MRFLLAVSLIAVGLSAGCATQDAGGTGSLSCGPSPAPKIGEFHADPGTPDSSGSQNC